jgi:hypothetical protein
MVGSTLFKKTKLGALHPLSTSPVLFEQSAEPVFADNQLGVLPFEANPDCCTLAELTGVCLSARTTSDSEAPRDMIAAANPMDLCNIL